MVKFSELHFITMREGGRVPLIHIQHRAKLNQPLIRPSGTFSRKGRRVIGKEALSSHFSVPYLKSDPSL